MTRNVIFSMALLFVFPVLSSSQEWQPLFNGKDLSGWSVQCKPEDREKNFWRVDNETILADSIGKKDHDYVWLVSDQEYDDFILRFAFQAYQDSPGNSGVQIRSRYDNKEYWLNGPQIDIHPSGPWRTGMMWDETRGNQRWIFPDIPNGEWVDESMSPKNLTMQYHDEGNGWNEMSITAWGTTISADLNGVRITGFNGAGIINDTTHQQKQVGMKGHIALQIHKGDQLRIRFKDISILPLNRAEISASLIQKSKPIAGQFKSTLKGELKKALQEDGFAGSIEVCKTVSAALEDKFTKEHERIAQLRRISLKTRNPERHTPTPVEAVWLNNTEQKIVQGMPLQPECIVQANQATVLFPIVIDDPVCLMCHGNEEVISEEIKEALSKHYPNDKARGYNNGDLRGALTIEWDDILTLMD